MTSSLPKCQQTQSCVCVNIILTNYLEVWLETPLWVTPLSIYAWSGIWAWKVDCFVSLQAFCTCQSITLFPWTRSIFVKSFLNNYFCPETCSIQKLADTQIYQSCSVWLLSKTCIQKKLQYSKAESSYGDPQVRHGLSDNSTGSFTTLTSKEMQFSLQN